MIGKWKKSSFLKLHWSTKILSVYCIKKVLIFFLPKIFYTRCWILHRSYNRFSSLAWKTLKVNSFRCKIFDNIEQFWWGCWARTNHDLGLIPFQMVDQKEAQEMFHFQKSDILATFCMYQSYIHESNKCFLGEIPNCLIWKKNHLYFTNYILPNINKYLTRSTCGASYKKIKVVFCPIITIINQ